MDNPVDNLPIAPDVPIPPDIPAEDLRLDPLIRQHVEWVIREYGMLAAPDRLGIGRTTLYRWTRKWRRADRRAELAREEAELNPPGEGGKS